MAWRLAGSLVRLRDQVNAKAPNRNKASDGTIGDPNHQAEGTGSDHNPNAAGVVCAFDITHDPAGGMDVGSLAENLIASRDGRIKYLIFNRRAVEPGQFGWGWQPYTGSDPHTSHLHVSVSGNYDSTNDWNIGGSNQGGSDMSTVDLTRARIFAFFIGGRNGQKGKPNALNGDSDAELNQYHVGHETNADAWEWYQSPECRKYLQEQVEIYAATKGKYGIPKEDVAKIRDELSNLINKN